MKVLLLGGTGAMGSHLANILSKRENNVVVTSRTTHESKEFIEYRHGNAKNLYFLRSLLSEHWDTVVDFMVYSEDEFHERADLLLNSTSHYIFLSSSRVYDDNQNAITEDSGRLLDSSLDRVFLSTNEYSLSKARQEDILCSSNKKNWTIVRPYITYSEKRLQLGTLEKEDWLYRALQGRTIVFSEDINNKLTTLTYGLDVARGIANLVQHPNAYGEAFHITNDYSCKWSDILEIYLDVLEDKLGYRSKILYQNLQDFLAWNPGKYQVIYDRLFNREFNNKKINKLINTTDFVQIQDGLKKCLTAFLDDPKFKQINWKNEALKDRYTNERTQLSEISGFKQKLKYIIYRYFNKSLVDFLEKVIR